MGLQEINRWILSRTGTADSSAECVSVWRCVVVDQAWPPVGMMGCRRGCCGTGRRGTAAWAGHSVQIGGSSNLGWSRLDWAGPVQALGPTWTTCRDVGPVVWSVRALPPAWRAAAAGLVAWSLQAAAAHVGPGDVPMIGKILEISKIGCGVVIKDWPAWRSKIGRRVVTVVGRRSSAGLTAPCPAAGLCGPRHGRTLLRGSQVQ